MDHNMEWSAWPTKNTYRSLIYFDRRANGAFQVLTELLSSDPAAQRWLDGQAAAGAVSGEREVEEHYWAQLTRGEVRRLHDKYRIDHELFGFKPDYYLAMAKEEEDAR